MIKLGKIFITGASGFVGQALLRELSLHHTDIVAHFRGPSGGLPKYVVPIISRSFATLPGPSTLEDIDVIIHCAARVHVMNDIANNPLAQFRAINVNETLSLARQAARVGVRRFVFISSIKVNGEKTERGRFFSADDVPAPEDAYAVSKKEAEEGLKKIGSESGMEVVILRPPLMYGPGVKGNFASVIKLVRSGLPIPLGAVENKRSLVGLDNLISLIVTCIDHPAAANQVFLVSDGQDLSTTELLRALAKATGRPSRLIPVPAKILEFGAKLLGKEAMAQRLLGSLQVDISKTRELLGWEPPVSVEEGLQRCVAASSF